MLFYGTTLYGLQTGLCFAVLALGLYISYSILDFPDLSVDGTFPLGGVVCTILMLRVGASSGRGGAAFLFCGTCGRNDNRLSACQMQNFKAAVGNYCHDCFAFRESGAHSAFNEKRIYDDNLFL